MPRCSTIVYALAIASFLLEPVAATAYVQNNITHVKGYKLLPGVSSVPAPVVVAPDQNWWGIDGEWNTFSLRVGYPATRSSVIASTANQLIWTVDRQACTTTQAVTDASTGKATNVTKYDEGCGESRGYTFNTSTSRTWKQKGFYQLWVEKKLGIDGRGLYGFDNLGLGLPGEEGPSVPNSTIGTLITPNFWFGHLGLHPKPTNFSAFEEPIPSFMTNLFARKNIPSLSFGYTAGARYHNSQTVLGSLTLGGYDAAKIISNDLTFIFAPDNERDLVVGVASLTANTTDKKSIDLLKKDDVNMFIDSSIAELWLPIETCKAFEVAFGLTYDNKTGLYLVDDVLHTTLLSRNPSITFTLGQKYKTDSTVQITLPYAAFDLTASPPYRGLTSKSRYFPIRRGENSSQWVLGRTFLQEAYLTVDWERQNFSVSAVDWTYGKASQISAIVSPVYAVQDSAAGRKASLSSGAIIGIAVGSGFVFALVMIAAGWWFWRRRHQRKLAAVTAKYEEQAAVAAKQKNVEKADEPPTSPIQESETGTGIWPKAELSGESATYHELGSGVKEKDQLAINEVDSNEAQIFEMPGCMPAPTEAGGRQLSEKESMVVRERIYNGVDPAGTPDVSPTGREAPRRLAPISPAEVMINGRMPSNATVSPVTPRTPSARDGAFLEAGDTFFQPPPYRPPRDGRLAPAPTEDTLLSPISPMESTDTSRRRFSYES